MSTPEQKGNTGAPRQRRPQSAAPSRLAVALVCAMTLLGAMPALAAGGHHAVDDAAIADPGACKIEGWVSSEDGGERLAHAGGACRVGPIELNASAAYAREHEGGSINGYSLQGKWATPVARGFSVGLLLASGWQARTQPRWVGTTVSTLFTWTPRDDLAFHMNLGRDFVNGGQDLDHSGVAVEWTATPGWTLLAERFVQLQTQYLRGGLRWAVNDAWTIDLSRAHSLSGRFGSIWTIGTSWQWDRR